MRYHLEEKQRSIHKPSLDDNIHVITIAISFPFLFFFFKHTRVIEVIINHVEERPKMRHIVQTSSRMIETKVCHYHWIILTRC